MDTSEDTADCVATIPHAGTNNSDNNLKNIRESFFPHLYKLRTQQGRGEKIFSQPLLSSALLLATKHLSESALAHCKVAARATHTQPVSHHTADVRGHGTRGGGHDGAGCGSARRGRDAHGADHPFYPFGGRSKQLEDRAARRCGERRRRPARRRGHGTRGGGHYGAGG